MVELNTSCCFSDIHLAAAIPWVVTRTEVLFSPLRVSSMINIWLGRAGSWSKKLENEEHLQRFFKCPKKKQRELWFWFLCIVFASDGILWCRNKTLAEEWRGINLASLFVRSCMVLEMAKCIWILYHWWHDALGVVCFEPDPAKEREEVVVRFWQHYSNWFSHKTKEWPDFIVWW